MRKGDRDRNSLREAVLLVLGCFVTLVWSIAVLVPLVFPDRKVDPQVHLVMLTVAAALFGGAAVANRKQNGNGTEKGNGNGA